MNQRLATSNPMKIFLIGCLLVVPFVGAHANLGDTEQQLIGRYGKEVFRSALPVKGLSVVRLCFQKDDLSYDVVVYKGHAADESIFHPTLAPLTAKEVDALLANNSQGQRWHQASLHEDLKLVTPIASWQRDDGVAHLDQREGQPRFLFHAESRDLARAVQVAESSGQ